ncbi:MAG TPA: VOC family protein [Thermomicrobiales bacterium]|nr:VOC family protein [Thermomicrobiales bacterium]
MTQKITPCLWFDKNAEDAANFYVSVFKNSEILDVSRYTDAGPGGAGDVLTVLFRLDEQEFMGLNGGPEFTFSEAISFQIDCKDQEEVDYYWSRLSEGGEEGPCGWLKDKFGLSWQVVPSRLTELIQDPDRNKANRVMQAMFRMSKLDITALEEAAETVPA